MNVFDVVQRKMNESQKDVVCSGNADIFLTALHLESNEEHLEVDTSISLLD